MAKEISVKTFRKAAKDKRAKRDDLRKLLLGMIDPRNFLRGMGILHRHRPKIYKALTQEIVISVRPEFLKNQKLSAELDQKAQRKKELHR